MRIGHVIPTEERGPLSRWGWPIGIAAATVVAVVVAAAGLSRPTVNVYPTTDFAALPVSAGTSARAATAVPCVSVQRVNNVPKLVDEACGSLASTFRVIGRVDKVSDCVRDADQTFSAAGGSVCLDYDWAHGQCLHITRNSVTKVDCAKHGAVQPEIAIIGAVDVTYCREGGIAHAVRHFTVCTLAGDKNCPRRTSGI